MVTTSCSSDMLSIPPHQQPIVPPLITSYVPRTTTGHAVRSTTTHVARSHSLRYHDKVDRCDDLFLFPRDDSNQRTSHAHVQSECVHTSAFKSAVLQVNTAPSLSQWHRQGSTGSESRYRSTPTSNCPYPRPVACHVPRLLNTNSDPLLHASYCEYRPTTRSTHVAVHVIFQRDSPCHSLSSPLLKPTRLFPVLGEIERVATNLVLHQQKVQKLKSKKKKFYKKVRKK